MTSPGRFYRVISGSAVSGNCCHWSRYWSRELQVPGPEPQNKVIGLRYITEGSIARGLTARSVQT